MSFFPTRDDLYRDFFEEGNYLFSPFKPDDPDLPKTVKTSTRQACLLVGVIGCSLIFIKFAPGVIATAGLFWLAKKEFSQKVTDLRLCLRKNPVKDMPLFQISDTTEKILKSGFNWKIGMGVGALIVTPLLTGFTQMTWNFGFSYLEQNFSELAKLLLPLIGIPTSLNHMGNGSIQNAFDVAGWVPPRSRHTPPPSLPGSAAPS
jgi:hypothetical protein